MLNREDREPDRVGHGARRGRLSRRLALSGLAALAVPRPTVAQQLVHLVVGAVVAEDSLPLWYAAENGLFRSAGLNVDVQRANGGFAAPLAVISGVYNICNSNLLSVIVAHSKAVPLTIVSFSGMYNGSPEYNAVITLKGSTLQSAADLKGKVMGTAGVNDLNSLAVHCWMDRHGGDFSNLKVVEIPYPAILPALEEGRIDVGGTLQPFLSTALASGKFRIFADALSGIAPRFAEVGWIATPAWSDANPEAVRRFARVMRDAQAYCNAHHAETAPLLAAHSGADVGTILRGGRETYAQMFADGRELQPLVDAAAKYGMLDQRFDASEIISPVVRALGAR